MALQIRRGLEANLPSNPAEGELLYATDSGNLYIGVSGSPNIINLASGGGGGNSNVQGISDLSDVASISGVTNGQALLWNASANEFQVGDIPAGYADSDVQTFLSSGTLADHIIPAGNELYDLGSATNRFRDLYLSGNTIDLGGTEITRLANGAISFGNNVVKGGPTNSPFLTDAEFATSNAEMQAYVDALESRVVGGANVSLDSLAEVANALANSNTELSTVSFTGNYTDLQNRPSALALSGSDLSYDGTTIDLSAVVGQVGPQGPQGNVGATGPQGVQGPAGNDGAQGDKGDTGDQGPQGVAGADGVSVSSATISTNDLVLTLSNAATINAGNVRGPVGPAGADGADSTVAGPQGPQGNVGATGPAGADGSDGADGADGVGVTAVSLVGGNLVFAYSNTSTQDVGNIQGPQGPQGAAGNDGNDGQTISSASVTNGVITLTLNDLSTVNVTGNVQGADGADGATGPAGPQGPQGNTGAAGGTAVVQSDPPGSPNAGDLWYDTDDAHTYVYTGSVWAQANPGQSPQTLSLAGNVITISGSNSNVDLTTILGAVDTDTDAQDLSLAGNVISLTGQSGNVDLTSLLGAYVNTDSQALTLTGNTLSISGGNSVDFTAALGSVSGGGGGSNYGDANVATYLNGNLDSHIIPDTNATYDIGSAEYKIRHLYLSDNSLYFVDDSNTEYPLNVQGGNLFFNGEQVGAGGGGGSQNLFANIAVSGQNTITADSTTDTLTFAAGSGISITTNSTSDTVTIAATGGGGGGSGATVERFKLNYATNGNLDSTSDKTSGINSISIDSTTSGEVSITFTGYNYPPASVMLYGYDYANNKYYASSIETTMATREIEGGGSSGSPTLFDGSATPTIKLRLREAETGASRSFGTATHAWIQMVMYD